MILLPVLNWTTPASASPTPGEWRNDRSRYWEMMVRQPTRRRRAMFAVADALSPDSEILRPRALTFRKRHGLTAGEALSPACSTVACRDRQGTLRGARHVGMLDLRLDRAGHGNSRRQPRTAATRTLRCGFAGGGWLGAVVCRRGRSACGPPLGSRPDAGLLAASRRGSGSLSRRMVHRRRPRELRWMDICYTAVPTT